MKKFIIKLAAVTGIIVIIAGISALATEFSLVTLAIVFAAIITENALCGAYLGKNKHSKKYVYRKYNIYRNNNIWKTTMSSYTPIRIAKTAVRRSLLQAFAMIIPTANGLFSTSKT